MKIMNMNKKIYKSPYMSFCDCQVVYELLTLSSEDIGSGGNASDEGIIDADIKRCIDSEDKDEWKEGLW